MLHQEKLDLVMTCFREVLINMYKKMEDVIPTFDLFTSAEMLARHL